MSLDAVSSSPTELSVVDAAVQAAAASLDWSAAEEDAARAIASGDDWEVADSRRRETEATAVEERNALVSNETRDSEDDRLLSAAPFASGAGNRDDAAALRSAAAAAPRVRAVIEGGACILTITLIWVGAGELSQSLYADAPAPFLLTYVNVSEFMVLLPLAALRERLCGAGAESDWRAAARAAARIAPLWFIAQCSFNAALLATSVGSATALSATDAAFALMLHFAATRGFSGVSRSTFAGVFLVTLGALIVGAADSGRGGGGESWRPVGDALALFSAFCYAAYSRAVKAALPLEGNTSMLVFFGFVGLFTAVALAPAAVAVAWMGWEDTKAVWAGGDHAHAILAAALIKGLVDNVLSDLLWARAIQVTSAMFTTVGLSLTIPLAVAADALMRGLVPSPSGAVGALAIFMGFLFAAVGEASESNK